MQQSKPESNQNNTQFKTGQRVVLVDWNGGRFGRYVPHGSLGTVQQVVAVRIKSRLEGEFVDLEALGVVVVWDAHPCEMVVMGEFEISPAQNGSVA